MSPRSALPPHRHGEHAPLCDVSAAARSGMNAQAQRRRVPHIVILGAGFGGLSAATALAREAVNVTVIDRRNHHLFQPLLYQVATAALSPAQIAAPIRTILRRQLNATVLLAEVTGVDSGRREVILGSPEDQRIPYDYLVIATGAQHSYFGNDGWKRHAVGLKSLEDATEARRRILLAFEKAEATCDAAERRRLLTFVIVGGGPTGVELAGAIAEIARHALASDFRNIDPHATRVVLIESGSRILVSFPPPLSANAKRRLEGLGVEVRLGAPVTACDASGVSIGEARIEARTILWAAGVAASPAAKWLGALSDRAGRAMVARDLSLPGHPDIFVIGDTAHAKNEAQLPFPGIAPVAKQQGHYVARVIAARLRGRTKPPDFSYRNFGNLATIGRKVAIADFGRIRLTGMGAWFLWSAAHIFFLIGFRNRISVAIDWFWSYLTFERGARLISHAAPVPDESQIATRPLVQRKSIADAMLAPNP